MSDYERENKPCFGDNLTILRGDSPDENLSRLFGPLPGENRDFNRVIYCLRGASDEIPAGGDGRQSDIFYGSSCGEFALFDWVRRVFPPPSIIIPAQEQIALLSHRAGDWEIYVMNTDGINRHNITNNPVGSRDPD